MANQPYVSGTVTVGTTATLIASPSGPGGIYLSNTGATVFLGGPNVTTSGVTAGAQVLTTGSIILPTQGPAHDLYGICATSTAVSFVYPGGN